MTDSDTRWNNDAIQVPRLLAGIFATQENIDYAALCDSMDLARSDIDAWFRRADDAWERIKAGVLTEHEAKDADRIPAELRDVRAAERGDKRPRAADGTPFSIHYVAETIGLSFLRWTRLVDDDNELRGTPEAVEQFGEALQRSSIPDACATIASARGERR